MAIPKILEHLKYNKYKLFNNSLTVDVILQHRILVTLKLPSWILCYKKRDICLSN